MSSLHYLFNDLFLQTYTVTDTVQKIAESYNCNPIEGMLSHQLEQNIIDGRKTIIQNPTVRNVS